MSGEVHWFNVVAKEDSKEAMIRLFGYIGQYYPVNSSSFAQALDQLNDKYELIKLYINSGGGDVAEGTAIFNMIQNNPVPIDIYNIGMAASMGGVLLQAGRKRYMASNAKLMIHKVSGGVWGNSDKLRETADQMDKWEEDLLQIFVDRTGLKEDKVRAWFQRDKDTWFNGKEALKDKLVDELIQPVVTKKAPANLLKMSAHKIWSFYDNALQEVDLDAEEETESHQSKVNQNSEMNLKALLLAALALPAINAEATDDQVVNAIKALVADKDKTISDLTNSKADLEKEKTDLENKLKEQEEAAKKEKAEALIDNAISANKLQKGEREQWVKDAIANYDLAKRAIDKMAAYKPLSSRINAEDEEEGETKPSGSASARLREIKDKTQNQ